MASKRSPSTVVGLEIDACGLTAVKAATTGRLTVESTASALLPPGVVRDGEVVDPAELARVLRELFAANRDLGKRVRVGVANQRIIVRVIEVPPIPDAKDFDTAVRFVADQDLPMPLETAVLDYHRLDVVDTDEGPRQRVLLVAARRDMVTPFLRALRSAGLQPVGIDVAGFAMVRALSPTQHDDEQVLYASIGGVTNLVVAQGSLVLFTRAASGGFEVLAVQLADRCRLTLEHAHAWLRHVGLDDLVEDVDGDPEIVRAARDVLSAGVRRVAAEVRTTLDFRRTQTGTGEVSRGVLTGPAAAVPGFARELSAQLGMPVEVARLDGAGGEVAVAAGLAIEEVVA